MARRNRKSSYTQRGRDGDTIASWRQLPLSEYVARPFDRAKRFMSQLEDRRRFHPEGMGRPAISFLGRKATKLVPKVVSVPSRFMNGYYGETVPWRLSFEVPESVLICVRRNIRRQVLHAFRIAGKKGLGGPHFNEHSLISCKR